MVALSAARRRVPLAFGPVSPVAGASSVSAFPFWSSLFTTCTSLDSLVAVSRPTPCCASRGFCSGSDVGRDACGAARLVARLVGEIASLMARRCAETVSDLHFGNCGPR